MRGSRLGGVDDDADDDGAGARARAGAGAGEGERVDWPYWCLGGVEGGFFMGWGWGG